MVIPHQELSQEALTNLIDEFVTREGTDYGEQEAPLATKVAQVRRQLERGTAVIVFSEEDGSCSILPIEQLSDQHIR